MQTENDKQGKVVTKMSKCNNGLFYSLPLLVLASLPSTVSAITAGARARAVLLATPGSHFWRRLSVGHGP